MTSHRLGNALKRVVLRAGNEFGWILVEEYATLRQREINEERNNEMDHLKRRKAEKT